MGMNLQVERLRALPVRSDNVFQGGVVRLPIRVDDESGGTFVPASCVWMSHEPPTVHMSPVAPPREITPQVVLSTLADFASNPQLANHRPGRIEVADRELAEFLRPLLADVGVAVELVPEAQAIDALARHLADSMADDGLPADLTHSPGMTRERMHAFAEAAQAFYAAKPWKLLTDADLIHVAGPKVDKGLRYFSVMGAGGESFGLSFFPSVGDFRRVVTADDPVKTIEKHPLWSVTYDPADMLPPGEAAKWEEWELPVAGANAYPFPARYGEGKWDRPSAGQLATMEGLLRAMASVTEMQLDAGQWTATVPTADGPVAFSFEVGVSAGAEPVSANDLRGMAEVIMAMADSMGAEGLLNPPSKSKKLPKDPKERARALVNEAELQVGRAQLKTIRAALRLDPDCAEAHILLADREAEPDEALKHFERARAAARKALGEKALVEQAGRLWSDRSGRTYLRASAGVATELAALNRGAEAADIWREMIRLDESDRHAATYLLAIYLLEQRQHEELAALVARYAADEAPILLYAGALLAFRTHGDTPGTKQALALATKANRRVVDYLTGRKRPDEVKTDAGIEAADIAVELGRAWYETPGSLEWLEANAPPPPKRKKK